MGGIILAYVAGLVTMLNPCVLPLLPILMASAFGQSRWGPAALTGGLVLSFSTFGLFIIAFGYSLGLDEASVRTVAAILLIAAGAALLWPSAQLAFSAAAAPLVRWGNERLGQVSGHDAAGQFAVGVLLGTVWAPCVGPTLGVAIAAASTGEDLAGSFGVFLVFGLGVATSILAFAYGSRKALAVRRTVAQKVARVGKPAFGAALLVVGALIMTGLDRLLEAYALEFTPGWLVEFTTRF